MRGLLTCTFGLGIGLLYCLGLNSNTEYPASLESLGMVSNSAVNGDSIVLPGDFNIHVGQQWHLASHNLSITNTMFARIYLCMWHQDTLGQIDNPG